MKGEGLKWGFGLQIGDVDPHVVCFTDAQGKKWYDDEALSKMKELLRKCRLDASFLEEAFRDAKRALEWVIG